MVIPKALMGKWKLLRSFGDNKKIAAIHKDIIEMDVSRAFRKGECSDEVFEAIAGFYKEKEEKLKAYL